MDTLNGFTMVSRLKCWLVLGLLAVLSRETVSYQELGCFQVDQISSDSTIFFTSDLTPLGCAQHCAQSSYNFAAVQDGYRCLCSKSSMYQSTGTTASYECYNREAVPCTGNKTLMCGSKGSALLYRVCTSGKYTANCQRDCPPIKQTCNPACDKTTRCDISRGCDMDGTICLTECIPGMNLMNDKCETCGAGKFGPNCVFSCSTSCPEGACHRKSGACSSACPAGKRGNFCLESCPLTMYGEKCDQTCNSICKDGKCDDETGHCKKCNEGAWGSDCSKSCPVNCFESRCNISGKCDTGCKKGFYSTDCAKKCGHCADSKCVQDQGHCVGSCSDGYWGAGCLKDCSDNCLAGQCDKDDGKCSQGCDKGYWGLDCKELCRNNCLMDQCNSDNGTCEKGCVGGWYGLSCEKACPENCTARECNGASGNCDQGCMAGWRGEKCLERCPHNCTSCDQLEVNDGCCSNGMCGVHCDKPCSCQGEDCPSLSQNKALLPILLWCIIPIAVVIAIVVIVIVIKKKRHKKPKKLPIALNNTALSANLTNGSQSDSRYGDSPHPEPEPLVEDSIYPQAQAQHRTYATVSELPVDTVAAYITDHDDAFFTAEYENLLSGQTAPWAQAEKQLQKNRYKGLMAYDHSRVVLPLYHNDPNTDFINANYLPDYSKEQAFIAAQGPYPKNLVIDFWRMVWHENIMTVVALASPIEQGRPKYEKYWPEQGQSNQYKEWSVTLEEETVLPDYTIRDFTLHMSGSRSSGRAVRQFHFTCWPDQGVPKSAAPLLHFHRKIRRHNKRHNAPILVHCSAGIGRTGTLVALDMLLQQARTEGVIDVQGCVNRLRKDRIQLVQTKEQYVFLYYALNEAIILGQTTLSINVFSRVLKQWQAKERPPFGKQFQMLEDVKPVFRADQLSRALSEENEAKNRFRNIVAPGEHQVVLKTDIEGRNDYINAVHVHGYNKQHALQVTQMPLEDTVIDFWRMVWDYKHQALVVLLSKKEKGAKWCPTQSQPVVLGDFTIRCTSQRVLHRAVNVVTIELQRTASAIYANYGFNPDGSPVAHVTDGHGSEVQQVEMVWVHQLTARAIAQTHTHLDETYGTNLRLAVMCRDGASQSGVYVAGHYLLAAAAAEAEVDVYDTVRQVRLTRPQFISDQGQFRMLYDVVLEYIDIIQNPTARKHPPKLPPRT